MIKKISICIIACIVVCVITTSSFADCSFGNSGIIHGYNGTSFYDQYWVQMTANDRDYNVSIVLLKNGVFYSERNYYITQGNTAICYSDKAYYPGSYSYNVMCNPV